MQCKACQPCTELVLRCVYLGNTVMSVINMMVGVYNLNYYDQIISLILRDLWFRTAVPVPSTSIVMDSILI